MDLVVRCYRRAFDIHEWITAATRVGGTPRDQSLIGLWLKVQAHASGLSPLIQMAGAESLPAGPRATGALADELVRLFIGGPKQR